MFRSMARISDNPVLVYWIAQNIAWDRWEQMDMYEIYVDRLSAFINPVGFKKVLESREAEEFQMPKGPKSKEELGLSEEQWAQIRSSPMRPAILNHSDEGVFPGDIDASGITD